MKVVGSHGYMCIYICRYIYLYIYIISYLYIYICILAKSIFPASAQQSSQALHFLGFQQAFESMHLLLKSCWFSNKRHVSKLRGAHCKKWDPDVFWGHPFLSTSYDCWLRLAVWFCRLKWNHTHTNVTSVCIHDTYTFIFSTSIL